MWRDGDGRHKPTRCKACIATTSAGYVPQMHRIWPICKTYVVHIHPMFWTTIPYMQPIYTSYVAHRYRLWGLHTPAMRPSLTRYEGHFNLIWGQNSYPALA